MMRTLLLVRCLTSLLILLTAGCGERGSSVPESASLNESRESVLPKDDQGTTRAPLKVVATFSILGDWLTEIGGDDVEVTTLVGPDGDAHTFEPTPRDAARIADADCVFELGLGFETWLDSMMNGTQSDAERICVSDSITPRVLAEDEGHAETDPHVWHDPVLVISIVRTIEEALCRLRKDEEPDFRSRANHYVAKLENLHSSIADMVRSIPEQRRVLVTTHDTFGYFADRFGFRVSSVLGTVSSEAADPSADRVAEVVRQIRAEGVPAVFTENILNPGLTEQIAREAGVSVIRGLCTDALGPEGTETGSYVGMMNANVRRIVEALR
jgi:zinc/manganese transport system substrate-binding protein